MTILNPNGHQVKKSCYCWLCVWFKIVLRYGQFVYIALSVLEQQWRLKGSLQFWFEMILLDRSISSVSDALSDQQLIWYPFAFKPQTDVFHGIHHFMSRIFIFFYKETMMVRNLNSFIHESVVIVLLASSNLFVFENLNALACSQLTVGNLRACVCF